MSEDSVFLAIYIITFLIGFPNTVLAVWSCIRKKTIPIDIFMLNLAVSDLIFLTFLPIKMKEAADQMIWNFPKILCRISLFMFFLPLYSSCMFLAAISTERYVCVAFPVKYKSPKRILYTILICAGIWVFVVGFSILPYKAAFPNSDVAENITDQHSLMAGPRMCYNNFTREQLKELLPIRFTIAVVFFFLPLLVCCFSYVSFIRILLRLPLISRHRKLRAIGLALGMLLIFACSFAPLNISHLVGFIKKETPDWRMKALMLSTLNACYDQIVFFCISRKMRRVIKVCAKAFFQFYVYLRQCTAVVVNSRNGISKMS